MMGRFLGILGSVLVIAGLIFYYFYNQAIPVSWEINAEESSFTFISTKNGDISEEHSLNSILGEARSTGEFVIRLDLRSIETGIDIRNERMRDFLFEVEKFPILRIEGKYELSSSGDISPGENKDFSIPLVIKLHGVEKEMEVKVNISRLEWNKIMVTSAEEIIINARDFNLEGGLLTLQEMVGLSDISPLVPITFKLVFIGNNSFSVVRNTQE